MTKSNHGGLNSDYRPQQLTLPDGRAVTLRLMEPVDKAVLLRFSRALPPNDLLFLRTDITLADALDNWIRNLESGATVTVIAEIDGEVAGYASLHHDQKQWTRRVGEIRVLLGPKYRGAGLGRRLAEEVFQIGRARGVKKMAAMLTPDQAGARAAFERLGFQVEALLQAWVADRNGRPHDLLVMSHDVEGVGNSLHA